MKTVSLGAVQRRRNRQTGTIVEVFSAEGQGLDDCDGETKWYVFCEKHLLTMGYSTRRDAEWAAAHPVDWCEGCQGHENATLDLDDDGSEK
jgi:hypothetical protein